MRTTDLVEDEVRHRASAIVDYTRQLEKNAAIEALRYLIGSSEVTIESMDGDVSTQDLFDKVLQQLRSIALARGERQSTADIDDYHAGEASVIVCAERAKRLGESVVFFTNDTNAGKVATVYLIESRHFGHMVHELVCAGIYTAEQAFAIFERAIMVSGIQAVHCPKASTELSCIKTGSGQCSACDPPPVAGLAHPC